MISFEDALQKVVALTKPLAETRLPLSRMLGKVLVEDIKAPFPLPRFDNSSVDGYGFRSDDTKAATTGNPLPVYPAVTINAGFPLERPLAENESVKIMTGAQIPDEVDAVVMREEIEHKQGQFLSRPAKPLENIRHRGDEVKEEETILNAGMVITPPVIGLLAACGIKDTLVHMTPRVSLIVTGYEIVVPGKSLKDGQVYDSNGPGLMSALSRLGIEARLYRVGDNPKEIERLMRRSLYFSNVVICAGGISVGDRDFVRPILASLGVKEVFWGIAMKPGKPTYLGEFDHQDGNPTTVFGLPGNPVAALVGFELLVKTALLRMMGHKNYGPSLKKGILTEAITRSSDRAEFIRGRLEVDGSTFRVTPLKGQESHMLTSLAKADCLIYLPMNVEAIRAGEEADILELYPACL